MTDEHPDDVAEPDDVEPVEYDESDVPFPDVPVIPDGEPDEPDMGEADDADVDVDVDPLADQGDNDPQDDIPPGTDPEVV
jgi:hypothetical protein